MNTTKNAAFTDSAAFFALVRHPLKFRIFLLKNLPAAFFSGLRIREADDHHCIVIVPFKWFTRNPFRSTYFACLSMAAELSTGILAMAPIYRRSPTVSMLVISIEGMFFKKATGVTRFVCEEGRQIKETVQKAIDFNEPQTLRVLSSGYNEGGELVAEFWITWSFKVK